MDIECEPLCPIILGHPFLRTVGAVIDMKEGNIKFQFPLKKGMEHFPRKKIKLPFESVTCNDPIHIELKSLCSSASPWIELAGTHSIIDVY